ncbi:hypothetical protein [Shimia sediminis]|uniref:hypothetical protein n=1 Tax=Shimia sediminis TaxID=2497945 RepID=UPI0013E0857B|nr:hypothetical protein [Shimia sediminis]
MKQDCAAYYCGMSLTSFIRAVRDEELPPGRKGMGGTYWLRQDLETAMVGNRTKPKTDFDDPI